jgi:hypothetical protein
MRHVNASLILFLFVGGIAVFVGRFSEREGLKDETALDRSKMLEQLFADSQVRRIVFQTRATIFGVDDTNHRIDIYMIDRHTGDFALISSDASGNQGNGDSFEPSISADGRYVAFRSASTNFVAGDSSECDDVFVKDLDTGAIICASTNSAGQLANGASSNPAVSADGRFVTFRSSATNLAPADIHPTHDTFTKHLYTQVVTRACLPLGLPALTGGRADQRPSGTRLAPAGDRSEARPPTSSPTTPTSCRTSSSTTSRPAPRPAPCSKGYGVETRELAAP